MLNLQLQSQVEKSVNLAEIEISYKSKVKPSERAKIISSKEAYEILQNVWSDKIEYIEEFVILCLNRANQVLGWVKIGIGGTAGCVVDAKIIFQIALKANATSIILSHNHPSGNLKPSEADTKLTKKLKEAGSLLDITVMDHLILTTEGYFSFTDEGMM